MKCKYIKKNGEQCGSFPMAESEYCWIHSPDISSTEKHEAFVKGGKTHKPDQSLINLDMNLASTQDICALLADTIMNVRKGVFSARISNTIGYLAFILVRTIELTVVEKRLEELENRLNKFDYITVYPEFKNVQPQTEKN